MPHRATSIALLSGTALVLLAAAPPLLMPPPVALRPSATAFSISSRYGSHALVEGFGLGRCSGSESVITSMAAFG